MSEQRYTPDDLLDLAEYFADHHARYWKTLYALRSHVNAHGPIRMRDGRLCGWVPDGNTFDSEAIAQIMPDLITHADVTFSGSREHVERVLSIVLEELPDMDYTVKHTVDAKAANAVIRAGGEAAEALLPHRVQKNKLGVR